MIAPFLSRHHAGLATVAALAITAFGGLLRLDAFVGKYGTLDRPAWARVMTQDVAPLARAVRPGAIAWNRESRPYVGGDPINYLAYAREMRTFYQPHVREPVFLATTRLGLWALDDQDAGLSLASAAGSMLAIFATYLLGAALISPAGGLACAAILAIEYEAIIWSVDGWRDDTFMALSVLAAWAIVLLRSRVSFGRALLVGVAGGLVCLTRITAIAFLLPALVWLVVDGPRQDWRVRARHGALAFAIMAAIVAPYLISCAIASGDPLLAVNYHTTYYRFAEGLPTDAPMGALDYIAGKFARSPVATADTAAVGLFVHPFMSKWNGLRVWAPHLDTVLRAAAAAGLLAWFFTGAGRLLLVIVVTSLLPYAFTWNVGGGSEWRFTMHVYAFYIVAAVHAMAVAGRAAVAVARDRSPSGVRAALPGAWGIAAVLALASLGAAAYVALPWFVVKEAIARGEATSVEAGGRDWIFFGGGWTRPRAAGNVTARVSTAERATIWLPLPATRSYDIVVRLDPVVHEEGQRVTVLLNNQLVGRLRMTWDPQRVGSYRLPLPASIVRAGRNELTLVPEFSVAAGAGGPAFEWIAPETTVGVRLWYVRVSP
jgi:hypothetical protein